MKNPQKSLAITKIVLGVIQWVINLFSVKHGTPPTTIEGMINEADKAREAND